MALGSDYPFPLGEVPSVAPGSGEVLDVYPGQMVETMDGVPHEDRCQILYKTALEFMNMGVGDLERHDDSRGFRCTDRFTYLNPKAVKSVEEEEKAFGGLKKIPPEGMVGTGARF